MHFFSLWVGMNLSQSVSVPDIGRAERLPVVVWIHGGGYGCHLPAIIVPFIDSSEGMTQVVLLCIPRRLWLPIRRTELLRFLFSIALVPLVTSVHRSNSLFIDSLEGFLAGPSVKKRGALNVGLRVYHYLLPG
jgi:hypothetical protein